MRSLQNGMVQFYALAMMLGLLVLIGAWLLWPPNVGLRTFWLCNRLVRLNG